MRPPTTPPLPLCATCPHPQADVERIPYAWPVTATVEEERAALADLLCAYSAFDDAVGYCQGMNFVAAVLLRHMPKEVR